MNEVFYLFQKQFETEQFPGLLDLQEFDNRFSGYENSFFCFFRRSDCKLLTKSANQTGKTTEIPSWKGKNQRSQTKDLWCANGMEEENSLQSSTIVTSKTPDFFSDVLLDVLHLAL